MPDLGYYHLTRTTADRALAKLLGRTLQAGQRALVLCPNQATVEALDQALWLSEEPDWLPHGTGTGVGAGGSAARQPIWLATHGEPVNAARYLFLIDAVEPVSVDGYERIFDLFDGGSPAALAAARLRWRASREAGLASSYWREGAHGWERQG